MLNTPYICLISIVVAICIIGIILLIVFGCLNKNKKYGNYRTFGGEVNINDACIIIATYYSKFLNGSTNKNTNAIINDINRIFGENINNMKTLNMGLRFSYYYLLIGKQINDDYKNFKNDVYNDCKKIYNKMPETITYNDINSDILNNFINGRYEVNKLNEAIDQICLIYDHYSKDSIKLDKHYFNDILTLNSSIPTFDDICNTNSQDYYNFKVLAHKQNIDIILNNVIYKFNDSTKHVLNVLLYTILNKINLELPINLNGSDNELNNNLEKIKGQIDKIVELINRINEDKQVNGNDSIFQFENELEELTEKLRISISDNKNLQDENTKLKSKIKKLNEEIEKFRSIINAVASIADQNQTEIMQIDKQLKDKQETIDKLDNTQRIEELEKEVKRLNDILTNAITMINKLGIKQPDLIQGILELSSNIQLKSDEITRLSEDIIDKEKRIKKLLTLLNKENIPPEWNPENMINIYKCDNSTTLGYYDNEKEYKNMRENYIKNIENDEKYTGGSKNLDVKEIRRLLSGLDIKNIDYCMNILNKIEKIQDKLKI